MAQWLGQYSGNTHRTAVSDAQELLRHAVNAFTNASTSEKPKKAKAVRTLAKRLLAARTRFLKARLSEATDPAIDHVLAERAREIAAIEQDLSALITGGVQRILNEFAAQKAAETPSKP